MYSFYFPFPVKHMGLFTSRFDVIAKYRESYSDNQQFTFRERLPDARAIASYSQLVKKNDPSKEYLGSLLLDQEEWKFVGALADLDNLYLGFSEMIEQGITRLYFMTNTGGHHADNTRYQLFCPLNQLFFIVELLNEQKNFPEIAWIDIDAHFGNGDKTLWDKYRKRMGQELNNVTGFCLHNDAGDVTDDGYIGKGYERAISRDEFCSLIEQTVMIDPRVKFVLLFFGTDLFVGDYGDNQNIHTDVIPNIIDIVERKLPSQDAHLAIIQTGGSSSENIHAFIDHLMSRT